MSYGMIGGDWEEIVGEMTRGGGAPGTDTLQVLGRDGAYELLGEMIQRSPAMAAFAARRAAASRPMVQHVPLQRARDWDVPLGPVSGSASTSTTISVQPQTLFRGEKLMCTDTASPAGFGTSITQIIIGQKLQRPLTGSGTLSFFFANNSLGNGIKWDTCKEALSVSLTISFISQCTFNGVVFGKAIS